MGSQPGVPGIQVSSSNPAQGEKLARALPDPGQGESGSWNITIRSSSVPSVVLSSYLPPANKCFSPTKALRTNRSVAKPARRREPKVAGAAVRCGRKRKRTARSAERKRLFHSGRRRGARCIAASASSSGAPWARPSFSFAGICPRENCIGQAFPSVPFLFRADQRLPLPRQLRAAQPTEAPDARRAVTEISALNSLETGQPVSAAFTAASNFA